MRISVWLTGTLTLLWIGSLDGHSVVIGDENPSVPVMEQVEYVMYTDPEFTVPEQKVFVSGAPIPLWLKALERSESALQRVTVDTFSIAHRRSMQGIDAVLPKIVALAGQPDLDIQTRIAAVKALIEFDAQEQAELLADLAAEHGAAFTLLVEPALVRWNSPAMADQWRIRLDDPSVGRQSLINAIAGLGAIDAKDLSKRLAEFAGDNSLAVGIRMAAARALGKMHPSGLTDQAAQLVETGGSDLTSDLLAIELLSRHSDPRAISLLQRLAAADSTVVQSQALERLFEIDPNEVLGSAETLIGSRDVNVRRTVAEALIWSKDPTRIAPLATLLNDVNPGLRRHVASSLVDLARQTELRDEVISQATAVLDQDQWRGCEQAALVLVNLDHKPAGDRLVDLMSHPRGEVMVTAGWGLRRLGQKKHLPAMLGRAQSIYDGFRSGKLSTETPGPQSLMAQLFLAFGQMRFGEADELARAYVPRDFTLGERPRSAAAWSLGYLHEGEAPNDLVKLMLARLNDVESSEPEYEDVRQMCAVSLGRMNAEAALPDLRKYAVGNVGGPSQACHWAIQQMTGEKPPEPRQLNDADYHDWFLQPIDQQNGKSSP
jgi:HEAT repeat protein